MTIVISGRISNSKSLNGLEKSDNGILASIRMRLSNLLRIGGLLLLAGVGHVHAQQPPSMEGVRQMYQFGGAPKKENLPPIRKVSPGTAKGVQPPVSPSSTAVMHLGSRYTLLLVNKETDRAEPVDSLRTFKNGDCLALEFEANRSSYLYVMNRQSDGNWIPLFPSAEMQDQANSLDPGQKVRVPKGYCFEIGDPPGVETLLMVLSRDPRDFAQLYEGIQGSSQPASSPQSSKPAETLVANGQMVNSTIDQMSQKFGGRNLAIRRVSPQQASQEPPHAVYVVNASDRPSATLVSRIEIRHR